MVEHTRTKTELTETLSMLEQRIKELESKNKSPDTKTLLEKIEIHIAHLQFELQEKTNDLQRERKKRKKAEFKLKKQTGLYQATLHALGVLNHAIFIVDTETGEKNLLNSALPDMLGCTLEDFKKSTSPIPLLFPSQDQKSHYVTQYINKLNTPAPHYDTAYSHPKGHTVHFNISVKDVPEINSSTFVVLIRDISENKRLTLALQKAEANLHALMESVGLPLHIMIIDRQALIIDQNIRHQEEFGSMLGKNACNFLGENDIEKCIDLLREFDEDLNLKNLGDIQLSRSDNTVIHCRRFLVPVTDPDGLVHRYMLLMEDITPLKKVEQEKQKVQFELDKQRALAINSDRLRSLGEMAANIAHELNQPLVGVRGLSEHLLIGLERDWHQNEDKIRKKIQLIICQADRMTYIIEHIRKFARESGKPQKSLIQVNDTVKSAIELYRAQLKTHNCILDLELKEDLPKVNINPFSLEEVLLNLVSNARDAILEKHKLDSQKTYKRILIETNQQIDNHNASTWVSIKITDSGIGISDSIKDRVFEPFFTTKNPDYGTGLGLAISYSIISEFGGVITMESQEGIGTTFTVLLPSYSIAHGSEDGC